MLGGDNKGWDVVNWYVKFKAVALMPLHSIWNCFKDTNTPCSIRCWQSARACTAQGSDRNTTKSHALQTPLIGSQVVSLSMKSGFLDLGFLADAWDSRPPLRLGIKLGGDDLQCNSW